jgi:hypothetical protein
LESPVYAILNLDEKIQELNEKEGLNVEQFYTAQPKVMNQDYRLSGMVNGTLLTKYSVI